MFKNLFRRNSPAILPDYSTLSVDIHSHLVAGIDDGSKTIEDSLELLREYSSLGFKKVITTPHIRAGMYPNTPETIGGGLVKLREAITASGIDIEVEAAAEYFMDEVFLDKLSRKELLTFGDKYLLFELSFANEPSAIFDVIFKMQVQGYRPVLAHPERYLYWYPHFDIYGRIRQAGALLMVNTISFTGYYGKEARSTAQKLADANLIDFLASDAHHIKHLSVLRKALSESYVQKALGKKGLLNKTV